MGDYTATVEELQQRLAILEKKFELCVFAKNVSNVEENVASVSLVDDTYSSLSNIKFTNNADILNSSCDNDIDSGITSSSSNNNSNFSDFKNATVNVVDVVDNNDIEMDSRNDGNQLFSTPRRRTLPEGYTCNECNKIFKRKWLLESHKRVHSGEKPFHCEICGKSFADRSNYRAHCIIHNGKSFECENCGKKFALKSYLKKHRLSACHRQRLRNEIFRGSHGTSTTPIKNAFTPSVMTPTSTFTSSVMPSTSAFTTPVMPLMKAWTPNWPLPPFAPGMTSTPTVPATTNFSNLSSEIDAGLRLFASFPFFPPKPLSLSTFMSLFPTNNTTVTSTAPSTNYSTAS